MTINLTHNKTMKVTLNINEVKAHLSSCLEKVSRGETVIVCKRNVPVAEIKPIPAPLKRKRPIGLGGRDYPEFHLTEAFFEPLPDEIVAAFDGGDA